MDPWEEILLARVDHAGDVAYRTLAHFDGERLERTMARIADARPDAADPDSVIAFWINAYNASVVLAVVEGESPETVEGRARMFQAFRVKVAGASRTLDEIEDVIERFARADPRIHFALCNAARGAPSLARRPYRGDRLDAALAHAVRDFVNDARKNRFDAAARAAALSPIFDWYRKDFERDAGSVTDYVLPLVVDPAVAAMLGRREVSPSFLPFDWTLNAAPGERPQ